MSKTVEELAQEKMLVVKKDRSTVVKLLKAVIGLLVVAGVAVFSWQTGNKQGFTAAENEYNAKTPQFVQDNMTVQAIERSVTGNSVEQDQKDALASAQKLVNLAKIEATDAELADATSLRMQEVAGGNFDSIPEEMRNLVAHSTGYENSSTNEVAKNAYNVLIGLKSQGFNNQEVVANNDAWAGVYVHPELGIAFVPLSSFADGANALPYSMMMVYEDGAWKFLPQSMIESVNIAGRMTASTAPVEATATAEATPAN